MVISYTRNKTNTLFFLRESRKVVNLLNHKYKLLWNYVDCRNELHLRWLKWCGFKFLRKINYGVNQKPFYEFIKYVRTNNSFTDSKCRFFIFTISTSESTKNAEYEAQKRQNEIAKKNALQRYASEQLKLDK